MFCLAEFCVAPLLPAEEQMKRNFLIGNCVIQGPLKVRLIWKGLVALPWRALMSGEVSGQGAEAVGSAQCHGLCPGDTWHRLSCEGHPTSLWVTQGETSNQDETGNEGETMFRSFAEIRWHLHSSKEFIYTLFFNMLPRLWARCMMTWY